MREIVLLMSERAAKAFAAQVGRLQERYGTESVVETVGRALDAAEDALTPEEAAWLLDRRQKLNPAARARLEEKLERLSG